MGERARGGGWEASAGRTEGSISYLTCGPWRKESRGSVLEKVLNLFWPAGTQWVVVNVSKGGGHEITGSAREMQKDTCKADNALVFA